MCQYKHHIILAFPSSRWEKSVEREGRDSAYLHTTHATTLSHANSVTTDLRASDTTDLTSKLSHNNVFNLQKRIKNKKIKENKIEKKSKKKSKKKALPHPTPTQYQPSTTTIIFLQWRKFSQISRDGCETYYSWHANGITRLQMVKT